MTKFAYPSAIVGGEPGMTLREYYTASIASALLVADPAKYDNIFLLAERTKEHVDALLLSMAELQEEEARILAEFRKEQQS